jgi:hypothetical protein
MATLAELIAERAAGFAEIAKKPVEILRDVARNGPGRQGKA